MNNISITISHRSGIQPGQKVSFTTVDGRRHHYRVNRVDGVTLSCGPLPWYRRAWTWLKETWQEGVDADPWFGCLRPSRHAVSLFLQQIQELSEQFGQTEWR